VKPQEAKPPEEKPQQVKPQVVLRVARQQVRVLPA
jgi:hypothetical protein